MIATLQQQVNTMLLQQQGSRVEVARPQVFSGRMKEMSAFVNTTHLYIRMKMTDEAAATQVAWVLSYMQGGKGGGSTLDREGGQTGPRRNPNAMDIDGSRGGDRTCYVCGKWGHMAKNCWERHKGRVVETP